MVPPLEVYKLNFDGSSLGNPGLAGFGGVLRDWMGNVIFSYAGPLGVRFANYVENFALFFGLRSLVERNLETSYVIEGIPSMEANVLADSLAKGRSTISKAVILDFVISF
ncbi:uncharacterized protein LOC110006796 [Amborella trichopoda]|uniref:uncharacterized protein LOC110006796 n=1 Tax=Amborella trichopoda TaxID=13333 RepID=UPI0009BD8B45|nr:uncharacterized protein LOC110006796 [Amborella trichopoda]|eukprot:XP_020519683.1 uncharacterized protein LOC110006796 [Amborella trichopoda]